MRRVLLAFLAFILVTTGVLVPYHRVDAAACATGNDITLSVSCEWAGGTHVYTGTLTIDAGVTVTADSNGSTPVEVIVDNLTLNGTITAAGEGSAGGAGTGVGESAGAGGGGGHGGNGGGGGAGSSLAEGGSTYGTTFGPITFGSGGGDDTDAGGQQGGAGGGAVKIFMTGSGTFTLGNGAVISASGSNAVANDAGAGAGGSIWIDATLGTITAPANGRAVISANGGANAAAEGGGGGSGGRIAITYATLNNPTRLAINAFGGQGGTQSSFQGQRGGAGTIFQKAAVATNGDLIIDDGNYTSSFDGNANTTQSTSSTQTFDAVTIRNAAHYVIPSGHTLSATGTLVGGSAANRQPSLTAIGDLDLPSSSFTFDGLDVTQNADVGTLTDLTVRNGQYTLSASGSTFTAAAGNRLTSLTLSSSSRFTVSTTDKLFLDTLTINSGGILTHATNTTTHAHHLDVSATGSITVNSGGSINVDGKGYAGGAAGANGNGPGGGTTSAFAFGGAHGGRGGHQGNTEYDSVTQPADFGSGGGGDDSSGDGGDGGGFVKLSVLSGGTITIAGTISATGDGGTASSDWGGGAGGSIFINAVGATVTGTGTLTANGENTDTTEGGGGGGGGRIAVHAATNTLSNANPYSAVGGASGSQSTSTRKEGGAGSIYLKRDSQTNGDLIIDNNNRANGNFTDQVVTASQTYDNITIKEGSKYAIPAGFTLTAASGGTLVGGGTRNGTITISGTLNPPSSSFTFDGLDVDQNATLGVVTDLTVRNGLYEMSASNTQFTAGAGNRLGSLTLNSGSRFSVETTDKLFLDTLIVNSGGILTHATNTSFEAHKLDVSATTSITVNSGGLIDVDGKGFVNGTGPGVGTQGAQEGAGGGYGGEGGDGNNSGRDGGPSYGSPTSSLLIGSGGGDGDDGDTGGDGGGAIRLAAPTVTINSGGTVSADGTVATSGQDGGGGSGGTVYIDATTSLAGTGTVTANGGGAASANNGGGGGGGRIIIYYAGSLPGQTRQAFGGVRGTASANSTFPQRNGGAGTIYLKSSGAANGDLIVTNNYSTFLDDTTQSGAASQTYDTITISAGTRYFIPSGSTLALASGGALTGGGTAQALMTVNSGATFTPSGASFTVNDVDVTNNGTFTTVTGLTVTAATFTHGATGNFSAGGGVTSLTLSTGATFTHSGTNLNLSSLTVPSGNTFNLANERYYPFAQNFGTLSVTGRFSQDRLARFFLDALTVPSGGVVTHASNTASVQYRVDMSATTSIDVQAGGSIDVSQRGYAAQNGPGAGESDPGSFAGGGGYGGEGGTASSADGGTTYGSLTNPDDLGSGGGDDVLDGGQQGGAGGGAARLIIGSGGTITVNGTISANGEPGNTTDGGGGSGGSIWIDAATNTIAGTGTLKADGANCKSDELCGGGGGGRIAIYYTSGNPANWTKQAYGGAGGTQSGANVNRQGAAGTIFVKSAAETDGDLTIDNNNQASGRHTRQVGVLTQAFKNIIVRNGACVRIPNLFRLRKAAAGLFTFGGTVRPCLKLDSGGKLDPGSSTFNPSGVDIDSAGELEGVTTMTLTDASLNNTTTFGGGCSSLTLGSGGNLNFVDSATFTCTTVTAQSGGSVTHAGNSTSLAAKILLSVTTLDVQSGGTITAAGGGFDGATGTAAGTSGTQAGGGGHGGAGGQGSGGQAGGGTYGSASWPETMGSGGGNDTDVGGVTGGAGGGVIKLVVSGTMTVNGTISATGSDGTASHAGGGAGGSVLLSVGIWAGSTGCLTADGGAGAGSGSTGGGGGGGGRIAVYFEAKTYTGCALSAAGGAKGGTGAATAGAAGSTQETQTGSPPVNGFIRISPSNPEVGQNIVVSASATDDVGISKIEIYLDGTAPGNLVKTCNFSPAVTPAECQHELGSLSAGSHSVTVKSYDTVDSTDTDTVNFTVTSRTAANSLDLSRAKVSTTAVVTLTFTLSATSTGTLTLTFPSQFTVTSAPTSGSSCLSSFGFTSTTMTATKTNCTGTVSMTGGTVTNPSVAGAYTVTWTNDNGSSQVFIVEDDSFSISASVDPTLTFNVGTQTSACDGTFTGNGGTLALGSLTTSAVGSSDVSSVPHICTRVSTNAPGGAVVTVRSQNASLKSTSSPSDTIPSSTATLSAGTTGYGLCGGSGGTDTGRDSTTPTGAAPARSGPYGGSCSTSSHDVGALTTGNQSVWSVNDPTQNAFVRLFIKASVSSSVPGHDDYADVLTFIITGTY